MPGYDELAVAFQDGDILYGLDAPRTSAIGAIEKLGKDKKNVTFTRKILFFKRSTTRSSAVILTQNELTDAAWPLTGPNLDFASQYASDANVATNMKTHPSRQKLADSDHARGKEFRDFLDAHDNYNVKDLTFKNRRVEDTGKSPFRKTSKAGLEFQTKRHRMVHFVLEEIVSDPTGKNTNPGLAAAVSKKGHGESVTSAEIRWLFRHKDLQDVKDGLRFWLPDGEVTHEQLFSLPEWAAYHPKHTYVGDWLKQTSDIRDTMTKAIDLRREKT